MTFGGPIEDELAIRTLHDRYADAVFRRDADVWSACWANDGRWSLMGTEVDGRDAIVTRWMDTMKTFSFVAFFSQTGAIEIAGDRAIGRVHTHEVLEAADGKLVRTVGRYDDVYVRQDGRWLYQQRAFTLLKEDMP